ncbi:MAG: TonB-dependent receptor [Bacteroidota bacterium]
MKMKLPLYFAKKVQRKSLLLLFSLICTASLFAQREVTGTVATSDGTPLIGASVLVAGTASGTVTDIDGNFAIRIGEDAESFTVSYTGYETQEVPITAANVYDIILEEGVLISEVVVTGYTVDDRRKTPGSVSTIEAEALQAIPSGNVEQQLQGRVAGVTVVTNGQPGTSSQVRVRGYGALGGNQPLYVVDGVPTGSTAFLNPDDIESTTVLKDATAASIYGARAAGGVIVFTTKKGSNKGLKVTYNGMVGVTTPGEGFETLSPQQQADWTWNAIRNGAELNGETPVFSHPQYGNGQTPVLPDFLLVGNDAGLSASEVDLAEAEALYNVDPEAGAIYNVIRANKEGTDWYDVLTRNAVLNRHSLGFSGGSENSTYYLGLGFQEQEGIVKQQDFSRYSLRLNTKFDVLPGFRIGENIQATYRSARGIQGGGGGIGSSDDESIVNQAYRMSPIIPVFNEFGGYAGTAAPGFNNPSNVQAIVDGNANDRPFSTEIFGNVFAEYEPIADLVIRTSFGGSYGAFTSTNYTRRTYEDSENNSSFGFSQSHNWGVEWVWTNTLNYKKQFGIHGFDLLVGQEALNFGVGRGIFGSGINPFAQTVDFVNLSTVDQPVVNGGHGNGVTFASYFGRLNYDLNDKYIISGVIRRDGSSRFGSENRYGIFPAVSAAWRISAESFMDGVGFIDDLKLRGGYGIMGNSNNVNPNNQFSLFSTSLGASSYDIGGTNGSIQQGFFRNRIGNPAARWEQAITANVGIDALLFDGKLDLGVEVWSKQTEDLLFQLPVTAQTGFFANPPSVNVGEMLNTGVDVIATYRENVGEFGMEVTVNGGFLNNEIVSLAPGIEELPDFSDYRGINVIVNRVGRPLSNYFGYNVVGLFRDDADVEAHATQPDAAPGRFKFEDINNDGVIDEEDRTDLGSPIADFTGGLTLKFTYKNFDLSVYSFASLGNEIYNVSKRFTDFYQLFPGAAMSTRILDSWTPNNLDAEIPIIETNANFSNLGQSNSFYVEDGSYFRLQNLTLGFNLPSTILNSWNMDKLRLFVSANNLFTITNYSGLDPGVGGDADTRFGIDRGNFPVTQSFTFGANVGF